VVVELTADFNDIDNEAKTGAEYGFSLSEVEAESVSTGFTLEDDDILGTEPEGGNTDVDVIVPGTHDGDGDCSDGDIGDAPASGGSADFNFDDATECTATNVASTTANDHILTKTAPTLTSVDPISGNLTNGTQEVYGVKITADSAGDVSVYSLRMSVTSGGSTTFTTTGATLVDEDGDALDYDCSTSTDVAAGTTEIAECILSGTPETVSAGSSKTFYLKGAVGGVDGDDSLSVQMLQTASDFDVDGAGATVDAGASVDGNAPYAIVWSDVSSGNDTDTATAQWFGDNEVNGLDTGTVSNEVN